MTFQSLNPATESIVWEGKAFDKADVEEAVSTAKAAFGDWGSSSFEERTEHLYDFRESIVSNKEKLAMAISEEMGKPLWESLQEVGAMIGKVDISVDACKERTGVRERDPAIVRHKPHGVAAVFGPFNFPGHLPFGHIAPALLAGNTIVFKPSELTPRVGELLTEIGRQGGLPNGVLNLVQGGRETGELLSSHPGIDALFFTGSRPTGQILREKLVRRPETILALEMGGNNPLIIGSVQDLQAAAYLTIQSAYLTAGQRCTCARRLIVCADRMAPAWIDRLIEMAKTLNVGPYTEKPEPFMGPVINRKTAETLLSKQQELIESGALPLLPMQYREPAFLTPGLLDVTNVKERKDEELFGPLLQLIRADSLEDAIERANDTQYGLSAGILTDDRQEYETFYQKARAGIINWNAPLTGATSKAPFGGVGKSGNHRPGAYYAADYCAFPVASIENESLALPEKPLPGIDLEKQR